MRLTKISELRVTATDAGTQVGRVSDAILDLPERRVAYWQIDLGG